MTDTNDDPIDDLPNPICEYCGMEIEDRDQQCPAREGVQRCYP